MKTFVGMFDEAVSRAAKYYQPLGITAWQCARGKLRGDPVYRSVLEGPWITGGGTLLDVGCGRGLMMSLIAAARELVRSQATWPQRMIGVEPREKVAAIARQALQGRAEVMTADARSESFPPARVILVFDVFHLMARVDQDALLQKLVGALEDNGVLLMREVDESAGWRFQAVRFVNCCKAWFSGNSSRTFHFRSATEWKRLLGDAGLVVEMQPMGRGTPFGNVLFVAKKLLRTD